MNNKPVAWINKTGSHGYLEWDKDDEVDESIPLYTHPVKEITDAELYELLPVNLRADEEDAFMFARAILRKAQEK